MGGGGGGGGGGGREGGSFVSTIDYSTEEGGGAGDGRVITLKSNSQLGEHLSFS